MEATACRAAHGARRLGAGRQAVSPPAHGPESLAQKAVCAVQRFKHRSLALVCGGRGASSATRAGPWGPCPEDTRGQCSGLRLAVPAL